MLDVAEAGKRLIDTAVLHEDRFVGALQRLQNPRELFVERQDVGLLVPERDDQRQCRTIHGVCAFRRRSQRPATAASRTPTTTSATIRPWVRINSRAASP